MSTRPVNLPETKRKGLKYFLKENQSQILSVLLIVFVGLTCFALGRLTVKDELSATFIPAQERLSGGGLQEGAAQNILSEEVQFIGSKSGTKYHWPWCSFAQKIKEENKVFFESEEEAKRSGYTRCSSFMSQAPMGFTE